MLLRPFLLVALLWCNSSAYNLETSVTFPIYLRNGGSAESYNESQEPAYAGFSFDVTLKNNVSRILVGQPRAGEAGRAESPGALYYCNFSLELPYEQTTPFVTTTQVSTSDAGSGVSTVTTRSESSIETTTESLTTTAPGLPVSYFLPKCDKVNIFNHAVRSERGVEHKTGADAFGLNLGRIGDSDEYAVCTPLRKKVCPQKFSYTPGACYSGDPTKNEGWNFVQWDETKCFKDTIEIIFVVDGSESIGLENFQFVKRWLVNVTKALIDRYGEAVRTEVLQYSDKDGFFSGIKIEDSKLFVIPYTFNDALSIEEMEKRINNMRYLKDKTYTYYALRRVMEVEFPNSEYNETSKKIVVVLTDGTANDALFLQDWYNKYELIMTSFAVGVAVDGKTNFLTQLRNIANGGTSDERVLSVKNFDDLQSIVNDLTTEIENAATSEGSTTVYDEDVGSPRIGSSISASKDGTVHVGATGMYSASGAVAHFDISRTYDKIYLAGLPNVSDVEASLPNNTRDSYLGYSVVTGFFDGAGSKNYVASGAPRNSLKGAVVIYDAIKGDSSFPNPVTIVAPADGMQIASYFGGSLLSVDVNNDGKDDLLVGAPLYTASNYDEGRVFVYIGQNTNSPKAWADSYVPQLLSGDKAKGGRFGTTMADAGDLNLDGYKDVAIGAPLADEGRGAVYIYLGSANGLLTEASQKIHASTLSGPTLRYFGQSLQGNVDLDGNQYPDIFVGAPRSDSVIALKSRPVVKIYSTIEYTTTSVKIFDCISNGYKNCSSIKMCLFANGTSVETTLEVQYNLTIDSAKTRDSTRRLVFSQTANTVLVMKANINTNAMYCVTKSLDMKKNVDDYVSSITAKIDFDLSPAHQKIPFSSVPDRAIAKSNNANIGWTTGCASDPCKSDLTLTGELILPPASRNLSQTFTNGEKILLIKSGDEKLNVRINITNTGDSSFHTRVKVAYISSVSLLPVSTIASSDRSQTKCIEEEGVPQEEGDHKIQLFRYSSDEMVMKSNSWCTFHFDVSTDKLGESATLDSIDLNVTIYSTSSTSIENDTVNNVWNDSVSVRYQSGLTLRKDSSDVDMKFNYTEKSENITSVQEIGPNTPDVFVDFRIKAENGYSNIPVTEMTFTWPWMTQEGNPLLYLYKLECEKEECVCDDSKVNPYNLAISGVNSTGGWATVKPAENHIYESELNCLDTSKTNHTCESVTCVVTNMYDSAEVHFRAYLRVWTASITFPDIIRNETKLMSYFIISASKSTLVVNEDLQKIVIKSEQVPTTVKKYIPETAKGGEYNPLVVILAIVGALLFLAALIIILYLTGFFTRKSLEEMKLQAQEELQWEVAGSSAVNYGVEGQYNDAEIDAPNTAYVNLAVDVTGDHDAVQTTENSFNAPPPQLIVDTNGVQGVTENNEDIHLLTPTKEDPDYDLTPDQMEEEVQKEDPDYDLPPDDSNRASLELPPPPPMEE